jgi:endonuclease YncB( thermonuclease family)
MGNFIKWCCIVESDSEINNNKNKSNINNNKNNEITQLKLETKYKLEDSTSELKESKSLNLFSCNNIGCYCIVEKIIDGDTLVCSFKIPYQELNKNAVMIASKLQKDDFVYLKFKCRLFGIDAAEKNTIQGQIAILLISNILKVNQVYFCKMYSFDKYGRQLVIIYDKNRDITERLLEFEHSRYGKVYCRYDGTTKSDFVDIPKYKMRGGKLIIKDKVFSPSLDR